MNARSLNELLLAYWESRYAQHTLESRTPLANPAEDMARAFMGLAIFKEIWRLKLSLL